MLDAENFQSRSGEAVEDQIVFKIIQAPRTDILQIPAAKFPQPALQRLARQVFNRTVNRLEKAQRGFGIAFVEVLEIAERVQFGGMTDENFNPVQAARAAKW